jgi:ABC-type nitrate/sulfonate/bicarbonate transport system permease component
LRDFFDTYVTIFWSTPSIALLPLLVVWFGLTLETKLVLVFLSAFWPLVINTQVGIQNVDKSYLEVATAFGATRYETLKHVLFPVWSPASGSRSGAPSSASSSLNCSRPSRGWVPA